MADVLSKEKRSELMARIRGTNTGPERVLRSALRRRRIRYRSYQRIAGATVDVVIPDHRIAVFVHGCFWHGCPKHGSHPSTNVSYWQKKLKGNMERDLAHASSVKRAGWDVVTVWEHSLRKGGESAVDMIVRRIARKATHRKGRGGRPEGTSGRLTR